MPTSSMQEYARRYRSDVSALEHRRCELEWQARMSNDVMAHGGLVFSDEQVVKVFKPLKRKKRKKPLRQKRIKRVVVCAGCGAKLDPNGNFNRTQGRNFCIKCYKRLYFICLRCCQKRTLQNRDPKNNRLCKRCVRDMMRLRRPSNPRPMSTGNVRWGCGSRVHGKAFDVAGSVRTFGVEIETSACRYAERLEGKTLFGAKYDATCSGREFDSPILSGDEGLQTICDFCDHAKRRGWTVDQGCGVHIHLGMQDGTESQAQRIGVAYLYTYPSWLKLVAPERAVNEYCCPPTITPARLQYCDDFNDYCGCSSRYRFINLAAYTQHKTIEIRGLEGTLDKTLITKWVIAHLAFADFAANSTYEELERLFGGREIECWQNLKQRIGSAARYFGRVRVKRIREKAQ